MGLQREDRYDTEGILVESFEDPRSIDELRAELRDDNNQALAAALAPTDWAMIRLQETGAPVPDKVKQHRHEARGDHNMIELMIAGETLEQMKTGRLAAAILKLSQF